MPKNQNTITFIAIAVVLILIAVGTYFYYFVEPTNSAQNGAAPCQEGDVYNTVTGDRCLEGDYIVATTSIDFSN